MSDQKEMHDKQTNQKKAQTKEQRQLHRGPGTRCFGGHFKHPWRPRLCARNIFGAMRDLSRVARFLGVTALCPCSWADGFSGSDQRGSELTIPWTIAILHPMKDDQLWPTQWSQFISIYHLRLSTWSLLASIKHNQPWSPMMIYQFSQASAKTIIDLWQRVIDWAFATIVDNHNLPWWIIPLSSMLSLSQYHSQSAVVRHVHP